MSFGLIEQQPSDQVVFRRPLRVVSRLDSQDEMAAGRLQVADVRRVAAQGVLGDDDRQLRMVLTETLQPAPRRVAFAVVLAVAVLALDHAAQAR